MEAGLFGAARRVSVLLPLPLAGAYDYIDGGLDLRSGDVVEVPLSGRRVIGVVLGEGGGDVPESKLREVFRRFDVPRLPQVVLDFVLWVAAYTLAPPGLVLRMAISVPAALRPADSIVAYAHSGGSVPEGVRITPTRGQVLNLLSDGPPRTTSEITAELGVTSSVVKGLAKLARAGDCSAAG